MIAIIILSLAVVFLSALTMGYRDALEKARRELAESKEWSDKWHQFARETVGRYGVTVNRYDAAVQDLREARREIIALRSTQKQAP